MLRNNNKSPFRKLKYLLIIPVLVIATLWSCSQDELVQPELTEEEISEEMMNFVNTLFKQEPSFFKRIKEKPTVNEILSFYNLEVKNQYSEIEKNKIGLLLTIITSSTKNDKSYHKAILNEINNSKGLKSAYEETQQRLEETRGHREERQVEEIEDLDFNGDIPFAIIDSPPHPESCSTLSGQELKKCMSEFVSKHVNENFDTNKFKDLEPGRYRVSVQFKIDENGQTTDVRARGASRELEKEASQAILSLPQLIPGEQDGEKVGVLYGLPINFVIAE